MRTRSAFFLIGIVLLTAVSAAAQTPIEGGGSYLEALPLEDGQYRDTILREESSFYAVELSAGQSLRVTVRMLSEPGVDRKSLLPAYPKLTLYAPDRSERKFDIITWAPEVAEKTMKIRSGKIGAGQWPEGQYFFTVTLGDQAKTLRRREYDMRIDVDVRGRALPGTSPSPSGSLITTTPTPSPTVAPTLPPEGPPDGESLRVAWVVASFALGVIAGAGGWVLLRRRGS